MYRERVCVLSRVPLFVTPWPGLPSPWDFPGKNIGVGCHFLLQGIFLTKGSRVHLLCWQVDSLLLSHQGSQKFGYEMFIKDKCEAQDWA